jgi:hypothetical protein
MADIRHFRELRVYNSAMDTLMEIFEISKRFPKEETYSLTDQVCEDRLARFVQILVRPGENVDMRKLLYLN